MNIFGLDIEQFDADEAKKALVENTVERLPGAPVFLSRKECSTILGVSMKVINKLIESGQLSIIEIPDDNTPVSCGLFGQPIEQPRIEYILRSELVDFFERAMLYNKPILTAEEDH
jgi:hypothetical protein